MGRVGSGNGVGMYIFTTSWSIFCSCYILCSILCIRPIIPTIIEVPPVLYCTLDTCAFVCFGAFLLLCSCVVKRQSLTQQLPVNGKLAVRKMTADCYRDNTFC